jgi:hypothetical protein
MDYCRSRECGRSADDGVGIRTLGFVRNDQRQITGFVLNGRGSKGIQFVRKAN